MLYLLVYREGYIEVNSKTSRSFSIEKGGPQGSSFTPTICITFHNDLINFLSWSSSHLLADDLAAIVSIFSLLSDLQRSNLNHFYCTYLHIHEDADVRKHAADFRKICGAPRFSLISFSEGIKDYLLTYLFDELTLHDRCFNYWNKYLVGLADSTDSSLLFERACLNTFHQSWINRDFSIKGLRVSKRFIENQSVLEKCRSWIHSYSYLPSTIDFDMEEIQLLRFFPESFLA